MAKSSNTAEQIKALALRMDETERRVGNVVQEVINQQVRLGQVLSAHGSASSVTGCTRPQAGATGSTGETDRAGTIGPAGGAG